MMTRRMHLGTMALLLLVLACQPADRATADRAAELEVDRTDVVSAEAVDPAPLILAADEGERRSWRIGDGIPFLIKVDRRNGGSPSLVMGYEEIPPGVTIPTHRHLLADEIIFVQRGSGLARVGDREASFETGATIYIPRDTPVTIENTGSDPIAIAFVFSEPGFEEFMRDMSVPDGEAVAPLSEEELARIHERNRWHTIYE